jgi:hypothetical protein
MPRMQQDATSVVDYVNHFCPVTFHNRQSSYYKQTCECIELVKEGQCRSIIYVTKPKEENH